MIADISLKEVDTFFTKTLPKNSETKPTLASMIKELQEGKTVLDLKKNKDYNTLCQDYYLSLDETRKDNAVKLTAMMGVGGLWSGSFIVITIADLSMNCPEILFVK